MSGMPTSSTLPRRFLIACITVAVVCSVFFYFQNRLSDAEKNLGVKSLPQYNNPSRTIRIPAGKDFIITLDSNPTTGYGWRIAGTLDGAILKVIEIQHSRKQTKLVGAGGKDLWTLRGLRKGSAAVPFEYVRPWEKDVPPAKRAVFTVEVE